jgi:hypothetical protein
MAVSRTLLEGALRTNVVEIKWVRRIPKSGHAHTRRALATNSRHILNSEKGYKILRYVPPTQRNPLDTPRLNLVTYWDIFRQDYRNISCESAIMSRVIPVNNQEKIEQWWQIFEIFLRSMTAEQKKQFIDS